MLLRYAWQLIFSPREAWINIRDKDCSIARCYLSYLMIVAAIAPVSGFIGTTTTGWQIGDGDVVRLSTQSALLIAIIYYLAVLASVFIISLAIRWIGKTYGCDISLTQGVKLTTYAATPILLVGIVELYPALWLNLMVGLPALGYTIYLLYSGVPILFEMSANRGFLLSSALIAIGLVSLVSLLGAMTFFWDWGFAPQFVD